MFAINLQINTWNVLLDTQRWKGFKFIRIRASHLNPSVNIFSEILKKLEPSYPLKRVKCSGGTLIFVSWIKWTHYSQLAPRRLSVKGSTRLLLKKGVIKAKRYAFHILSVYFCLSFVCIQGYFLFRYVKLLGWCENSWTDCFVENGV